MVVLSLAAGHTVTDYPPEISSNFPAIFRDFLEKCLVVEDRLRLSASELLEHDFIKVSFLWGGGDVEELRWLMRIRDKNASFSVIQILSKTA